MQVEGAQSPTDSPLYGNIGQPPVPPRHRPTQTPTAPQIPPLPPRSTKWVHHRVNIMSPSIVTRWAFHVYYQLSVPEH